MRPKSFILHIPKSKDQLASSHPVSSCEGLFPYSSEYSEYDTNGVWIGMNGKFEDSNFQFSIKDTLLWIINDDSEELPNNTLNFVSEYGLASLNDVRSDGVILIFKDDRLRLFNGALGVTPLYYAVNANHILVATEAKAFAKQGLIPVRLAGLEAFQSQPYFKETGHCLLDPVSKLDSGCSIEIDLKTRELSVHHGHIWPDRFEPKPLEDEVEKLYLLLNDKVETTCHDNPIGIPLSGGFDSGAIAGMAMKYSDLHTYTMGSENINEFESARIMADFISSDHHEIIIKPEDLLPAILHGIFLNELADPVYAEGYSGLYFLFREAHKKVNTMLTGYGADLTLSNFLSGPLSGMHDVAEQLIRRTSWTGELTNYVPQHFNLKVEQPFLDPKVIDMIQFMPDEFKVREGVEKFIEREMIKRYNLMPEKLFDLKKKALHTGAGIDQLFNNLLGVEKDENYLIKSNFLYFAWKEIIFDGVAISNVDIDKLVYRTRRTIKEI